ncbi:peptidyl-prolyl cis-trans isomerase [Burkholderia gladioli]|uniref:peptidylprolyl isomerase n=1 Tax=Burkholderia gladioli TaxID=28095 RepID=UPI00264C86ED|nr:peptidyl-prolyl cis-trans isomerase [Burkholderia gladioli]MDN7602446.1 peptidyl-prolyl cis-trans isomerase [Burkholderia gladioli]
MNFETTMPAASAGRSNTKRRRVLATWALAMVCQCGVAPAALAIGNSARAGSVDAANNAAIVPAAASGAVVPLPANAIARVNDVLITRDQFEQARRVANTPDTPDTPEARAALKNQLIAREVLRQAAVKAHYDTQAQVLAAVEQAKTTAMTEFWLHDQVRPASVTDAQVRAKYDEVVGLLGDTELKPSAIVLKDRAAADAALAQLERGADFAQLARQLSQGPGAQQGGALNWVSFRLPIPEGGEQNWPQPLAQALVALPRGGMSRAPIEAAGGYWILRVDDKRATRIPAFDDVKAALRQQLETAALQRATIEVVVDLLKQARIQQ